MTKSPSKPARPEPASAPGPQALPGAPATDVAMLEQALLTLFAPWVRGLDLRVLRADAGDIELALPITAMHVHGGGVVCGQTLMSAADTAMVLAMMTRLGGFKPMTTVQLQTSFLRPVPGHSGGNVQIKAHVLRLGRSLAFGEVHLHAPDGSLAAHVTTTYALL